MLSNMAGTSGNKDLLNNWYHVDGKQQGWVVVLFLNHPVLDDKHTFKKK